jgi:hypothetical protein
MKADSLSQPSALNSNVVTRLQVGAIEKWAQSRSIAVMSHGVLLKLRQPMPKNVLGNISFCQAVVRDQSICETAGSPGWLG